LNTKRQKSPQSNHKASPWCFGHWERMGTRLALKRPSQKRKRCQSCIFFFT